MNTRIPSGASNSLNGDVLSKFLVYSSADSLNSYLYFSLNEVKLRLRLKKNKEYDTVP